MLHLDGTGVVVDLHEPLHLDGLLAAMVCRWQTHGEPPTRDEVPRDILLPCARWERDGTWGWRCSALAPGGLHYESLTYWRKRFREHAADQVLHASPNLENATYRAWNMPLPLLLVRELVGYAVGDRRAIRGALKDLRAVGKKRAHGHGRVIGITVERVADDLSLVDAQGVAARWLPDAAGTRLVRPRPPYWSLHDRTACVEVGTTPSAGLKSAVTGHAGSAGDWTWAGSGATLPSVGSPPDSSSGGLSSSGAAVLR